MALVTLCLLLAACLPDEMKKPEGPSASRSAQELATRITTYDLASRSVVYERLDAGKSLSGPITASRNTDFASAYCKTNAGDMHISWVKNFWVEKLGPLPLETAFKKLVAASDYATGMGKSFKMAGNGRVIALRDNACLKVMIPRGSPVIAGPL